MEIDARDMIVALKNQRTGALDETVQLYAMLEASKRETAERDKTIAELKAKYEPKPADTAPVPPAQ